MWDYGALDEDQERDYINAKMKMLDGQMPNVEVGWQTINIHTHIEHVLVLPPLTTHPNGAEKDKSLVSITVYMLFAYSQHSKRK